jgi:hypothetical protein
MLRNRVVLSNPWESPLLKTGWTEIRGIDASGMTKRSVSENYDN